MADIAPGETPPERTPEPIALALIRHLYRSESLDLDDVNEIADSLDREGEGHSAHEVRLTMLDEPQSQADWEVQQRRARMEVVPNGGNRG